MSVESVMTSNHLILCHPLFLLPSIFPSIRVLPSESALHIRWPEYWSFSFSISPSSEYSGLISFRIDWFDVFAVQGTLKCHLCIVIKRKKTKKKKKKQLTFKLFILVWALFLRPQCTIIYLIFLTIFIMPILPRHKEIKWNQRLRKLQRWHKLAVQYILVQFFKIILSFFCSWLPCPRGMHWLVVVVV